MNSTKETKEIRAEKAHSRRSFLRLGTLGAAAAIAGSVLPGTEARAQQTRSMRKAAGVRSQGTGHTATEGRQTRALRKLRSKGEYAQAGEKAQSQDGQRSRRSRSAARRSSPKATLSTKTAKAEGGGTRSATKVNRMAGQRAGMRSMKHTKQAKKMKS
ncbi:MAG TPA: hypothetical protein VFK86_19620 [Bauldia sp.]|nr:hypothetical protein [Bauldia sp.]